MKNGLLTLRKPGLWIAIYGPDGAGKSTAAEQILDELQPYFRANHRHHLRIPLLRRKASSVACVTQPHAQPPRGILLSHAKLLYVFASCWLTHLLVVTPWLAAGDLVIFDRYFHDHLIDPLRYRIPTGCLTFARFLSRLAPRPQLQFVLDVPAAELLKRKCEVDSEECERQCRDYPQKLGTLPNTIVVDASCPVSQVTRAIAREVLAYTHRRTSDEAHFTPA